MPRRLRLMIQAPALVAAAAAFWSPARAQQHGGGAEGHRELFYTADESQRQKLRVIGDERFNDQPVDLSPVETPKEVNLGTVMVLEGDMVVGRRDDLVTANLVKLIEEAKAIGIALDAPQVQRDFTPQQIAIIQALQTLAPPPRPGDEGVVDSVRESIANARIAPLLSRATSLVQSSPAGSAGIPPELVAAVKAAAPSPNAQASVVIVDSRFRWPMGIIPYFYQAQTFPASQVRDIEAAIKHWNTASNNRILLRPSRAEDPYYVEFVRSTGCRSFVGKVVTTGRQPIELGDGCLFDQVVHEIGHAVGLFHEQTRNDRDKFLIIQIQNAIGGTASNFQLPLAGTAQDVGPFDFSSVMLYPSTAFSSNGQPTMVVRPEFRSQVGTHWGIIDRTAVGLRGLSKGDVRGVEFLYKQPAGDPSTDLRQFAVGPAQAPVASGMVPPPETPDPGAGAHDKLDSPVRPSTPAPPTPSPPAPH